MRALMLRRTLVVTAVWIVLGVVVSVYDHLSFLVFQEYSADYVFSVALVTNMLGGLLGGLLGASLIVFYLKKTASQRSFLGAIALHTVVVFGVIVLVILLVTLLFQSLQARSSPFSPAVLSPSVTFLLGPAAGRVAVFWLVVASLTSLSLEVSDKYGPSVLRAFVLGRYHRPQVEDRCFMFLDMRSSTTIAERLGHKRYFDLLRQCFREMTEPILDTNGEIYQYVGDEVVVTWPLAKGVEEGNCIKCFRRIQDVLSENAPSFQRRFGLVPEFKAGLHAGEVTTGEVGTLRKDIVFTGDVLNTASRIQERCNALGSDLLVSGPLLDLLPGTLKDSARELERIVLRGHSEPVSVHALQAR